MRKVLVFLAKLLEIEGYPPQLEQCVAAGLGQWGGALLSALFQGICETIPVELVSMCAEVRHPTRDAQFSVVVVVA